MQELEQSLFGAAAIGYLAAVVLFILGLAYRRDDLEAWARRVLVAGFALHTAGLIVRWLATGWPPLSDLNQSLIFLAWSTVLVFVVVDRLYRVAVAGLIMVPVAFFMMAVASALYEGPRPLPAELQSRWLAIHVGVSLLAYSAFALSFATGFFYVVQEELLKKRYRQVRILVLALAVALGTGVGVYIGYLIADPTLFEDAAGNRVYAYSHADVTVIALGALVGLAASVVLGWGAARGASRPSFANRLPALHVLDTLSSRSVVVGLVLLGLGIISGAVWAHEEWGSWWAWEPKETWAVTAWVFYAAYLGLREFANWRGRNTAMLAIAGIFIIFFAFLGVNLFLPGRHDFN